MRSERDRGGAGAARVRRGAPDAVRPALGIVGGMGTLASAEFLRSIYERSGGAREQDAPICLLHSDPGFPDRSEAILRGEDPGITARLVGHLHALRAAGATRSVLCCVTLHHFLAFVPEELRRGVISLVDLIVEGVAESCEPHLLLCTTGTRRARVLERHPGWDLIAPLVRLPSAEDQLEIHAFLYGLKAKPVGEADLDFVDRMRGRYQVDALIAGCTEVHLVNAALGRRSGRAPHLFRFEDPLMRLACGLEERLHG